MYNYQWDSETGGYTLITRLSGVIKEIRPVFWEELHFLGFDTEYGWSFPKCDGPLLWAEGRRYFYQGEYVGETIGGGLFSMPVLKNVPENLVLKPVNIQLMVEKNKKILDSFVQKTLKFIYNTYLAYKSKVRLFYVAFSGGKDSLVMLDLVQRALPHDDFFVIFGNTTMEMKSTYAIFEQSKARWNTLKWHEAKTSFTAEESWKCIGYPARRIRWCCGVHKSSPSIAKLKEIYEEQKKRFSDDKKLFKVMAFDGIRAEESDTRATYSQVSDGNKHAVQFNCSPIFEWNTTELFLYMFEHQLPINEVYRYGAHRVGCKLCPMASESYECVLNHVYPDEIKPMLDIITSTIKKDFSSEKERQKYLENGGWKSRVGGRDLEIGGNKITEIKTEDTIKFVITDSNYKWDKWMSTISNIVPLGKNRYAIQYKEIYMEFEVEVLKDMTTVIVPVLERTKASIRFMYLFKNALHKAAYCVNCGECMAECSYNALTITSDDIIIKNCKHCETCMDSSKGCVVARSLTITGVGNNMSVTNISRYQNFGFRKEWLELFLESEGDSFWNNQVMGKYMIVGFKTWLKESGITINNAISPLGLKIKELGCDSMITWGIIYAMLAYHSPIVNWYVCNIQRETAYSNDELMILLGDKYSQTTKKNALSSLKETLRYSPIGSELLQGECEMKGRTVVSVTKGCWNEPEPLVILYILYLYAEHNDNLYSFTLSDLFEESEAISPVLLFGMEKEALKNQLQGLANDYPEYLNVDFNKGIMENIFLTNGKTANDVLKLI